MHMVWLFSLPSRQIRLLIFLRKKNHDYKCPWVTTVQILILYSNKKKSSMVPILFAKWQLGGELQSSLNYVPRHVSVR